MMMLQFDELVKDATGACCLEFDGRKIWIPKSACREPDLNNRTIEVDEWFVIERGLEVYLID